MLSPRLYQLSAALVLVCSSSIAHAYDSKFVYPVADNLSFNRLDKVNITYDTDYTNVTLWLFCRSKKNTNKIDFFLQQNAPPGKASFEYQLGIGDDQHSPCWFNVRNDDIHPNAPSINSVAWSYNWTARAQPASFGPPPPAPPSPSPSPPANDTSSSTAEPGLPANAIIGIGIGGSIAGFALLGVLVYACVRLRRWRDGSDQAEVMVTAMSMGDAEATALYDGEQQQPRSYSHAYYDDASSHRAKSAMLYDPHAVPFAPSSALQELPVSTTPHYLDVGPQELSVRYRDELR